MTPNRNLSPCLEPEGPLDENILQDLRRAISSLNPVTVQYMGWAGLKNGELLNAAEAAGFHVLVTGDKTVQFEQKMTNRRIAIGSLSAPHWPLIKDHVGKIAAAITAATPGSFIRVAVGTVQRRHKPRGGR